MILFAIALLFVVILTVLSLIQHSTINDLCAIVSALEYELEGYESLPVGFPEEITLTASTDPRLPPVTQAADAELAPELVVVVGHGSKAHMPAYSGVLAGGLVPTVCGLTGTVVADETGRGLCKSCVEIAASSQVAA